MQMCVRLIDYLILVIIIDESKEPHMNNSLFVQYWGHLGQKYLVPGVYAMTLVCLSYTMKYYHSSTL